MGIRSDQYVGISDDARRFLNKWGCQEVKVTTTYTYSDGNEVETYDVKFVPNYKTEVIRMIEGAWVDEVAPLYRYILPNGEVWEEYEQATPWHSGPMYFIGLRKVIASCVHSVEDDFTWSDYDIDRVMKGY